MAPPQRPTKPPPTSGTVKLTVREGERVLIEVTGVDGGGTSPPDPQPTPDWPNEPSGLTPITAHWEMNEPIPPGPTPPDPPYTDDALAEGNWRIVYNHPVGSLWPNVPANGWYAGTPYGSVVQDTAEQASKWIYPQGMHLGIAPATMYNAWGFGPNYRRVYFATWWKPSDPTDFAGIGQKLLFIFHGGGGEGGQAFIACAPNGQLVVMPEYPDPDPTGPDYRIRWPNVNTDPATLGEWHLVEWYLETPETKATPGRCQWWVDGVLRGDYTDVWNVRPMDMVQFSPTFGGNGPAVKRQTDEWRFRDCRVSVGTLVQRSQPAHSMQASALASSVFNPKKRG